MEIEVALARIGLTPESVAVSGLSSQQVIASVGAAADSLRGNIQTLRASDEAAGGLHAAAFP